MLTTFQQQKKNRKQKIPKDYVIKSFDLASLFTNILLKKNYEIKEIITDVPKYEVMLIIILMYKNVHFTFNYNIVELEKAFIPNLNSNL